MWDKLIAVTDSATCPRPLEEQLQRICTYKHRPSCIILRAKTLSPQAYAQLAKAALTICRDNNIELLFHSHWQLALTLGATALHLPLPILRSREFQEHRGSFSKIFTSVHRIEEISEAVELGATAIIAGHIYATQCKANLPPRGLLFLEQICQQAEPYALPVYAIGGIKFSQQQFDELKVSGATGACIMSGYMRI